MKLSSASLALVGLLLVGCGKDEPGPLALGASDALTEQRVRDLLPAAAAADPEVWDVIVKLGAAVSVSDLNEAPDLPLLALALGRLQWPPEARHDVRLEPTHTPLDFERALHGSTGGPGGRATLLSPEVMRRVTVQQTAERAHGDVWFDAPGAYEGRVRYKAVRRDGSWSLVAFEFPHTRARIERASAGGPWKLVRFPTWQPPAQLPRVSEAAPPPAAAASLVLSLLARPGVVVNGQEVRTFDALRGALRARAQDLGREPDGTSKAEVVVLADEAMPWYAVLWALQVAADPQCKAYRIHFGVRHRASGELGVLSVRLPKDRNVQRGPAIEPAPSIQVRLFSRDSGRPTEPEAVYWELVRRRAAGAADAKIEIAAPPPNGRRIRYGLVMRILDAVRRAGYGDVAFESAAMPNSRGARGAAGAGAASDGPDLERAVEALLALPAGTPIVKLDGQEVGAAQSPAPPIPDGARPVASGPPPEPPEFEDEVNLEGGTPAAGPSSSSAPRSAPRLLGTPAPPEEHLPEVMDETEETEAILPSAGPATQEPVIKDGAIAEPDSTDADVEFNEPGRSPGVGAFKGRGGDRRAGIKRPKDDAVLHALRWLAAHQSPDGGWEAAGFGAWCDGQPATGTRPDGPGAAQHDSGVTGLALCAFLGAGYTNRGDHEFAKVVSKGLRYLKNVQDPEGCFTPRKDQRYIYDHAVAAVAMIEAFGMTESPIYKGPAQKALDFIALSRNPYFAWRYGVKPGDNDTSVTSWMLLALTSAALINADARQRGKSEPLVVDMEAFDGIRAWLEKMTDADTGRVGYVARGSGPSRSPESLSRFPPAKSESMTAVGILARIVLGEDPQKSPAIQKGVDLCSKLLPTWNTSDGSIDMTYWYFGSLALHRVGGAAWTRWNEALLAALAGQQRRDTDVCAFKGSWDPVDPWGSDGGRVYATALLARCLEVPTCYPAAGIAPR